MRILFLVNWKVYYLESDNFSIQSPDKVIKGQKYWFFRYLPNDIEVDVIDFSKLPFMHLLEKRCLKFYVFQALKALRSRKKYDLIISHSAQSAVFFAFLRSVIGEKMPPHIVVDPASFNGGRDNFLEILPIKFAIRSIAGIIYHATIQKQYYEKHFSSFLKKTCFIPFGVDTDFFAPIDLPKENYVIAFGEAKRDYNTLLKAWLKLAPKGVNLFIVGARGINLFKNNIVSSNILLLKRTPIDKLKKLIAKALFVVLPLPYFNYSYAQMSLLQSMSMQKAVIITRTPGVSDYIKDNFDAIFVSPYDADDLANKIKKCLNDEDLVNEIGKQARLTILSKFNEKLMAERIYSYLMEIL